MLVKRLSLSKIGDLLKDSLGEEAEDYTFPEDFEKAVVDIGFKAYVYRGDAEPYDLIVIGEGLQARRRENATVPVLGKVKSVRFLGSPTSIPIYSFSMENVLSDIVLPSSITDIKTSAFAGCAALQSISIPDAIVTMSGDSVFSSSGLTTFNSNNISVIPRYTLSGSSVTEVNFPKATEIKYQACMNCYSLLTVNAPKAKVIMDTGNGQQFKGCLNLQTVNLGSIDNAVTSLGNQVFVGCTSAGLTITVYANADYISTLLTNIRNGATNATIIIKAASDLVYNNVSYSAGDTVVTSTV